MQVLVPHKFIGWALMLLQLVAAIALASAGFEHNLYNYAGTPPVPLSDMNRLGHFWIGAWWFLAYWCAFATILAVLAYALWRRGTTVRAAPAAGAVAGSACAARRSRCWRWPHGVDRARRVGLHNTNVTNRYVTAPDRERIAAEAEKTLLAFEKLPHPRITEVKIDVQLFPRRDARGDPWPLHDRQPRAACRSPTCTCNGASARSSMRSSCPARR